MEARSCDLPGLLQGLQSPPRGGIQLGESGMEQGCGPPGPNWQGWLNACCIVYPERLKCAVDGLALHSKVGTLTVNQNVVAACSRCRSGWAAEIERLATLRRYNPVYCPPSQDRIADAARRSCNLIPCQRELIAAAQVEHVGECRSSPAPSQIWVRARNAESSKWAAAPPVVVCRHSTGRLHLTWSLTRCRREGRSSHSRTAARAWSEGRYRRCLPGPR